jgi:hypothetical protein
VEDSSQINSFGTWTNNVQSRNVIFVASDDCGLVCAFNKVGIKLDLRTCAVICEDKAYRQSLLQAREYVILD